jgi:hypothetical protein
VQLITQFGQVEHGNPPIAHLAKTGPTFTRLIFPLCDTASHPGSLEQVWNNTNLNFQKDKVRYLIFSPFSSKKQTTVYDDLQEQNEKPETRTQRGRNRAQPLGSPGCNVDDGINYLI